MTNLKNNLYLVYFETYSLGLTKKWVYVSSKDDDEVARSRIDAFNSSDWDNRNFTNGFIVSQESFDNTVLPLIKEIGERSNILTLSEESIDSFVDNSVLKTWILSDDDCFQHIKKLTKDGKQWRIVQLYGAVALGKDDKWCVGYVDIDLDDYLCPIDDDDAETVISILSGYGYDEFIYGEDYNTELEHYNLIINNIRKIYGDKYLQIVAECVAEYQIGPDNYIVKPCDAMLFEDAKKVAYNFMKEEDK